MDADLRDRAMEEPAASLHASLTLKDFQVAPSEITRLLGISPSDAATKGDPLRTRSGRTASGRYPRSFWTVRSGLPSTATLEEHVQSILDSVESATQKLRDIAPPTVKEIYCTVIPAGAIPVMELSTATMERIAAIGCSLVIDVLYIDPEEE